MRKLIVLLWIFLIGYLCVAHEPVTAMRWNKQIYVGPLVKIITSEQDINVLVWKNWRKIDFSTARGTVDGWEKVIIFDGNWSNRNHLVVLESAEDIGEKIAAVWKQDRSALDAFRRTFGHIHFLWNPKYPGCNGAGGLTINSNLIVFASLAIPIGNRSAEEAHISARNNVVHEVGHAFAGLWFNEKSEYSPEGPYKNIPWGLLKEGGFAPSPINASRTWRQHPNNNTPNEIFADMFLGWIYDTWADDDLGRARAEFMAINMPKWLNQLPNMVVILSTD